MDLSINEKEMRWYALHAKSRHESVAFNELRKKSVEAFLPKIQVMSRRKDRRKMILAPLLPGYVFVHTDLNPYNYLDIIRTYGIVRMVGFGGSPVPVRDNEIESLQILNGTDRTVRNQAFMREGDKILIMEGPLRGLTGFYLKDKGKFDKVVVSIELLKRSLAVEMENWAVERIV